MGKSNIGPLMKSKMHLNLVVTHNKIATRVHVTPQDHIYDVSMLCPIHVFVLMA